MANVLFSVVILEGGDVPEFETPAGRLAFERFERRSDEILKDAMNAARKMLRKATPVRTRKLSQALRVSRIRRRRVGGLRVIVGYQVSSGRSRKRFYASITNARQGTRVSNWFSDAVNDMIGSEEFKRWQDELGDLFANALLEEFTGTITDSLLRTIRLAFRRARIKRTSGNGFLAEVVLGR